MKKQESKKTKPRFSLGDNLAAGAGTMVPTNHTALLGIREAFLLCWLISECRMNNDGGWVAINTEDLKREFPKESEPEKLFDTLMVRGFVKKDRLLGRTRWETEEDTVLHPCDCYRVEKVIIGHNPRVEQAQYESEVG